MNITTAYEGRQHPRHVVVYNYLKPEGLEVYMVRLKAKDRWPAGEKVAVFTVKDYGRKKKR